MKTFFKDFTGYIPTDIYLTAAELKDWKVDVFFKGDYAFAEISKGNLKYRVSRDSLSFNSNVATRISSNKYLTNLVLNKFISEYSTHAVTFEVNAITDEKLQELLTQYHKIVVKPVSENNGIGVTAGLTNLEETKIAIEKNRQLGIKKVLIENHIEVEKEYRVIMWKGEIIDALLRIPAYVTGDGHSTIQQLIEQKNDWRFQNFDTIFEPIVIDPDLSALIQKKNLTLESVLPENESLTVKTTCNLSTGGEVKRVELSQVDEAFRQMCKQVYQATWMNYCGLDLITPDITKPPVQGKTVINELNGAPGLTLAFFDDLATNRPFYGMFQLLEKMEHDPIQLFESR